jgi:hypothetical protein
MTGAAVVAGLVLTAGAASAAVTVSGATANQLAVDQGVLLADFDGYFAPHVTFTGNVLSGPQDPVTDAAAPPFVGAGSTIICCDSHGNPYSADATGFESVEGGNTSTFSATGGYYLTSFSFYLGSPDSYNHVTFHFLGGGSQTLDGSQIWGGFPPGDGDRSLGYRVYYDFNGAKVSSIDFSSDQNAFEADNFGGTLGVPEPASWALMISGFGLAGATLRGRRKAQASAA